MKLQEVLAIRGAGTLMKPGTNINVQVVKATTRQALVPEQDFEYEKAKSKNKEQEKADLVSYNKQKEDELENYFDDDSKSEEVAKKINTVIFSMEKDPHLTKPEGYTEFFKKLKGKI